MKSGWVKPGDYPLAHISQFQFMYFAIYNSFTFFLLFTISTLENFLMLNYQRMLCLDQKQTIFQ